MYTSKFKIFVLILVTIAHSTCKSEKLCPSIYEDQSKIENILKKNKHNLSLVDKRENIINTWEIENIDNNLKTTHNSKKYQHELNNILTSLITKKIKNQIIEKSSSSGSIINQLTKYLTKEENNNITKHIQKINKSNKKETNNILGKTLNLEKKIEKNNNENLHKILKTHLTNNAIKEMLLNNKEQQISNKKEIINNNKKCNINISNKILQNSKLFLKKTLNAKKIFYTSSNNQVLSQNSGTVIFAGKIKVLGKSIIVADKNKKRTLYTGLNKILVKNNDKIRQGTKIASIKNNKNGYFIIQLNN